MRAKETWRGTSGQAFTHSMRIAASKFCILSNRYAMSGWHAAPAGWIPA